jgi:putative transposase
MSRTNFHKAAHSAYSIHLHIYLVTRYRRKFLTQPIAELIAETVRGICEKNKSELLEWGGEPDHIHFLVSLHPDNNISQLVKSFKSVSTKAVIAKFPQDFQRTYRRGRSLWGRQKGIVSCGGAPLEIVKEYVRGQAGVPDRP